MDWYHLLYDVPAIVSGTTLLAYLWPRKMQPHFVPLLTFIVGLIVLFLPQYVDMALALVLPVALIHAWLGVSLVNHEPVKLPKLPEKKLRPADIRKFVTRAYPAEPAPEPEEAVEEPAQQTNIKSYVPPLT